MMLAVKEAFMKDTLVLLRKQHQEILAMLDQPERALELIHFVEHEHHPLEEEKLFPFMNKQKCLYQGGPRCTMYMGMRLESNPLEIVRKHLHSFYLKTDFRPPAYPEPLWLEMNNPLSIPFEEHAIGAQLAQSMIYLLSEQGKDLHEAFFSVLYQDYCRLLRLHIDKEDNCLFLICESALVPQSS